MVSKDFIVKNMRRFSQINYLKNSHKDLYDEIIEYTSWLDTNKWAERLYCWFYQIKERGKCIICGGHVKFFSFTNGYREYCSRSCSLIGKKNKTEKTCMEKYGVKNPSQVSEIKKKKEQTCLRNWGSTNYFNSDIGQEKIKNTNLEKYGAENPFQAEEVKKKTKETWRKNLGVDNPSKNIEVQDKKKDFWMSKYGTDHPWKNREILLKREETVLERYGVRYVTKSEEVQDKMKESWRKNLGVDSPFKSGKIQDKCKQTFLEKYNVKNPSMLDDIKIKKEETNLKNRGVRFPYQCAKVMEKVQETNLKRRGVRFPYQCPKVMQKVHETKKKNGTYGKSSAEDVIYQMLINKFQVVERQHKSSEYPFACDFYIPSEDLYIEYQGYWSHGKEAYDINNIEHQLIINEWRKKSEEVNFKGVLKNQYRNAIYGWSVMDPKKRDYARRNQLNWLEFFSLEDFERWYEKQ